MSSDSGPTAPVEFKLAYLSRCTFEDGKAYRGGILVVDSRGAPLEFRCTSAIRPNPVQRTLYGDSLDPYMQIELVGKPLLSAVRESFDILVVDDQWLLNIRQQCDRSVVLARRQGAEFSGASGGDRGSASLVDSPSGRFDPVVVEAPEGTPGDMSSAMSVLERAAVTFDPLEPFQRIHLALEKVHEQKALD